MNRCKPPSLSFASKVPFEKAQGLSSFTDPFPPKSFYWILTGHWVLRMKIRSSLGGERGGKEVAKGTQLPCNRLCCCSARELAAPHALHHCVCSFLPLLANYHDLHRIITFPNKETHYFCFLFSNLLSNQCLGYVNKYLLNRILYLPI